MRKLSIVIGIMGLVATLAPVPAFAQQVLTTTLTNEDLAALAAEFGSVLRFRQLGDTATLPKGRVDLGVQFASAPIDTTGQTWNVTRFVGRFGVGHRVDMGVWAGYNSQASDGMAGVDVKIALLTQGPSMPVSVAVRPSFSSTLGAGDIYAASVGADLSVSRAFGAISPYAGVSATSSLATERLQDINFERQTDNGTLGYVGLAYSWRSLIAAVEMEKGTKVAYAVRIGTRF
jgi:hypothetical protein